MPQTITAKRTKQIITDVRRALEDSDYRIVKTDEEIFSRANRVVAEICRKTKCLKDVPPFNFDMVPDQEEYSILTGSPFAKIGTFLRVDRVYIIDSDDNQVGRELTYTTPAYFDKFRADGRCSVPEFYTYDRASFKVLKPYSSTGYRIVIGGSRVPTPEEEITQDRDPIISYVYDPSIADGTTWHLALGKKAFAHINPEYYRTEFEKYKSYAAQPFSADSPYMETNELNLDKKK